MSWIGGLNNSFNQISSLTGQIGGQISNFTKEVLAEGTDDNIGKFIFCIFSCISLVVVLIFFSLRHFGNFFTETFGH